jgi:DNA-binding CsgD family transcriptional regulator
VSALRLARVNWRREVVLFNERAFAAVSPRQRQVVAALIAGDDSRAMTECLVISRRTVHELMTLVFAKVGVRSRRELLACFGALHRRDVDDKEATRLQRGA